MDLWTKSLSESVNGTNAGRKSLPEDKGPDVPADASSLKDKAPEPSLLDPRIRADIQKATFASFVQAIYVTPLSRFDEEHVANITLPFIIETLK
ncbi:hypothetical protein YC2023_040110 [Brassica napus]